MISVTTDYDFIKLVTKNPDVWPWVSDDNSDFNNYEPDKNMVYLLVEDSEEKIGYFALTPINSICFEIHTTMLPKAWGKVINYTKEVVMWIFTHTRCMKIITFVPESNKKALKLAQRTGLLIQGFLDKSFIKNGELIGQYILGIERGSLCQ